MSEYVVQVRKVHPSGELTGRPLTYRYDSPLQPGDQVLCPGNEFSGPFFAEVVELGSDYAGYIRSLLCRVAPDRPVPATP